MKHIITLLTVLFLSSLAVAQVPGPNTVGSKQLKRNAVKTPKIKNSAVTGEKIANETIDNTKLMEITHVTQFSLTNGLTQTVFEDDIITLQAKCLINDGGNDIARVLVFSTEDGTAFDGNDTATNLTAATAEGDREIVSQTTATTNLTIDHETDGMIMTPSGNTYMVDIVAALNLFGEVGSCQFGGVVQKVSAPVAE